MNLTKIFLIIGLLQQITSTSYKNCSNTSLSIMILSIMTIKKTTLSLMTFRITILSIMTIKNDPKHYDIQDYYTQHNDIQYNDTQYKRHSAWMTHSINDAQYFATICWLMFCWMSFIPSVAFCCYTESHNAVCLNAERLNAECHNAKCRYTESLGTKLAIN